MLKEHSCARKEEVALFRVITTCSSVASTVSMISAMKAYSEVSVSRARYRLHTQSSPVTGVPSENTRPGIRLKV